jgi:hypothetical protein
MVLGALGTCAYALETREPSYIGWPSRSFFIYRRPTGHWKPWDAWLHRDPPWPGGRVWSHRTRGKGRVHLSQQVRSRAIAHTAAPEPSPTGRWGPVPWDTRQHQSPPWLEGRVQTCRTHDSTGAHLSREARSGAIGHVAPPEPSPIGRCGLVPWDTWQHRSPPW